MTTQQYEAILGSSSGPNFWLQCEAACTRLSISFDEFTARWNSEAERDAKDFCNIYGVASITQEP